MKKNNPQFIPAEAQSGAPDTAEIKKHKRFRSVLTIISLIWTLVSTAYAIFGTCLLIARGWVSHAVCFTIVAVLCVYGVAFIVLAVLAFKDPKKGKSRTKTYKITFKIFKEIVHIVFLVLTAISMVGVAATGMNIAKWIYFIVSIAIASIQIVIKIAQLILRFIVYQTKKKYFVRTERFVDGKHKKRTVKDVVNDKKYKD